MTRKREQEPLDPEMPPEREGEAEPGSEAADESQTPPEEAADAVSLAREFEDLAIALDQKTKEAAEANEKYLRTYADLENYRKRVQRDQADFKKYANEQMALELLTVIDHLGLAIRHSNEAGGGGEGLQQGVELVHKQFRDVMEKFGIKPFKAEGEPFNPAMHDAMMQVETDAVPENTVVQVFQEGYLYHEKVLRHAKVGVARRPSGGASADAGEAPASDDGEAGD
jgi:molecular chaperone GrpE